MKKKQSIQRFMKPRLAPLLDLMILRGNQLPPVGSFMKTRSTPPLNLTVLQDEKLPPNSSLVKTRNKTK